MNYARDLHTEEILNNENTDFELCVMIASDKPKYIPFLYNGGWFIPGYGYSEDRLKLIKSSDVIKNIESMMHY